MATQADLMIGRIAVKNKFLTEDQLKQALDMQGQYLSRGVKKDLGEILVENEFMNQVQLDKILRAQEFSSIRQQDMLYGRIAARNNFVAESKIKEALAEQQEAFKEGKEPPRLGQILLKKGLLIRQQHNAILKTQERVKKEAAKREEEGKKDLLKNIKSCPYCSELVRECLYCGELIATEKSACSNCGHPIRGG